jgi:hypothetical protein
MIGRAAIDVACTACEAVSGSECGVCPVRVGRYHPERCAAAVKLTRDENRALRAGLKR